MLHIVKKFAFTTKSTPSTDFKSILNKFKEEIKQLYLLNSDWVASLERVKVKVANNKIEAPLRDFGTINLLDSQKAELTTFDPQVKYFDHSIFSF